MASTREIISLQFGHYSNFVGAHFWNIQELSFDYTGKVSSDINHDVLYREGLTFDNKVTYTPRLLLTDLKGSLKTLPQTGLDQTCAELVEDDILWTNVEKKEEPRIEKNDYLKYIDSQSEAVPGFGEDYDFGKNISTWTDFLYPRFHQRTVNIVEEFKHNDDEVLFETFNAGINIWKTEQFSEIFCDNIRHYSEECDSMQGFQILLDATDGFGGLATQCLQYLKDEYPNKSLFALPLIASHFSDNNSVDQKQRELSNLRDSTRLVNLVQTFEELFENASLFTPMCTGEKGWRKPGCKREFYNVNYDSESYYQSSSILASALDTISLKYRRKCNEYNLSDICVDMTGYGRKMAASSVGLPFEIKQKDYLIDHLDRLNTPLWTTLTPNCNVSVDKVFQHITIRGIPENKLKKPVSNAKHQLNMAAYNCSSVQEMFQFYFQCNSFASASNITVSPHGLQIKTPYPKMFSKDLDKNGFLKEFVNDECAETVPVISGLHNGNFIFNTLESLRREASRVKIQKLHKFNEDGLEADDFKNCLDNIAELQSNYQDNFEL